VHLKSELRKSESTDAPVVSKSFNSLFKNFFIIYFKLGSPKGISYPKTCSVVTMIGLW